jgi:toxin ParE1/3/4
MKRYVLRPAARQDRRDELRYYRKEAGNQVANKLIDALQQALQALERTPSMGSAIGLDLGVKALRAWRIDGFPLSIWYFERGDRLDVVRIVGQRQDAEGLDVPS